MKVVAFRRLQQYMLPGSLGVVVDTRYIRCFWPRLDAPTKLFADGSFGISVMGPPLPRNVIFPDDTVFEDTALDALHSAEIAVMSNGSRRGLVNLTDAEAALWVAAYDAAVAELLPSASKLPIANERYCLRDRTVKPGTEAKPQYEEFVAVITAQEAEDMLDGKVTEEELRAEKTFISLDTGEVKP